MAYTLISEQVLASAAASVTFSSIPQTYTDLMLEILTKATTAGGAFNPNIQFNGDTATNYSWTRVYGNGTSALSSRGSTQPGILLGDSMTTSFSTVYASVPGYSNTSIYKTVLSRGSATESSASAWVGTWRSTAAITSIAVLANGAYDVGTTMRLWGIK